MLNFGLKNKIEENDVKDELIKLIKKSAYGQLNKNVLFVRRNSNVNFEC